MGGHTWRGRDLLLLLFFQQAQLWGAPTAPSYIARPIMMAQGTEGDRYGKALPLALCPGRGSLQDPVGQLVLRPHLRYAASYFIRLFTSPYSSFPSFAEWG